MSLNMKKEIRAELRILKKARNKIDSDWQNENRQILAHSRNATRTHQRLIKDWIARSNLSTKVANKHFAKIDRRISILQGRLA